MADTFFIEGLNTLPEQVQLNKEDIKTNTDNIQRLGDLSDTYHDQIQSLTTKVDTNTANIATNTSNIATNTESIDSIKQSYLLKTDASNTYLSKTDASNTYLTKTDASNTYATKSAIKTLEYDYFDAVLTPSGFAKIQVAITLGNSITLFKDTDFTEEMYNIDLKHKTAIFNLYQNDEDLYISTNIKLDIGKTTSYYSDNDQPSTWYTGIGVIKLGIAAVFGNNYLCYIAYDAAYNNGLTITPIKKLN